MSKIQDIKDRWAKATQCCWQVYMGQNWDIHVESDNPNDVDAIANAPKDIQCLIGEIEFLLRELEKQPTIEQDKIDRRKRLNERYGE